MLARFLLFLLYVFFLFDCEKKDVLIIKQIKQSLKTQSQYQQLNQVIMYFFEVTNEITHEFLVYLSKQVQIRFR